ncbi:hypothetical protein GGX14DRAFT_388992 [Mycena pura]|uniref:PPM-type phosphatase domain-containing protein n=1 Tax=Mycena pura TaxID=153505 RepID=A0AAD6VSD5_9AGAR|nr:hypothetical protein GGX14DRAFT_388992 [Mycena pura]
METHSGAGWQVANKDQSLHSDMTIARRSYISKTTNLGSRSNSGARISKETTGSELEVSGTAHQLVVDCYLRFRKLKMTPSLPSPPASQSAKRVAVRTSFNMVHRVALLHAPYCHANPLLHHWQEDLDAAFTTNLKQSALVKYFNRASTVKITSSTVARLAQLFNARCRAHHLKSREFVPMRADARREGRCELTQHRQRARAGVGSLDGPAPAPDLARNVPSSPRRQRQPSRMEGGTVGAPRRIGRTMTTRCCRTREPVPSATAAEWEGHCELDRSMGPLLTPRAMSQVSPNANVSPAGWSRGAVGVPRHLARTTTQRAPWPAGLILKPPATYIRDEPGPQSLPPRWRARAVYCMPAWEDRGAGSQRRVLGGGEWPQMQEDAAWCGRTGFDFVLETLPSTVQAALVSAVEESNSQPLDDDTVSKLLLQTLIGLDERIKTEFVALLPPDIDALSDFDAAIALRVPDGKPRIEVDRAISGTTATVALIDLSNRIHVASVGDCNAILCAESEDGWDCQDVGFHHQCSNPAEMAGIRAEHPGEPNCVTNTHRGRLLGGMPLSRGIGDMHFKLLVNLVCILEAGCGESIGKEFIDNNITPPYMSNIHK